MKRMAAILIFALSVAACTPYWAQKREDKFARCPNVVLLTPLRGWVAPANDQWETRAEIAEFSTQCKISKTHADMQITLNMLAERKQVSGDKSAALPVFISTLRGDAILDKKMVPQTVTFEDNKAVMAVKPVILQSVPLVNGSAADRTLVIGFQLDDDQQLYFEKLRAPRISIAP